MASIELHRHGQQTAIQVTRFSHGAIREQQPMDLHENFCNLRRTLSNEPINWKEFLDVDREYDMLSRCNESFLESTFAWIITHYPPSYVIQDLLSRYQEHLFSNGGKVKSMLNIGLVHNSYDVVHFIATKYPFLMHQPLDNNSGDLPLHRVRDVDIASIILQRYPAAVSVPNFAHEIPLHCTIQHFSHPDHVRILIDEGLANNVGGMEGCGGVLVPNKMGKTPFDLLMHQFATGIDLATLGNPVYEIERRMWKNMLTMIYAIRGTKDTLILHDIINLQCPSQAVRLGQIMIPNEISKADDMGRYPLHLACSQKNCCKSILEHLMLGFKEVVHLRDYSGKYPLHHCALGRRSFAEGTELIYNAEPTVATIADDNGFLPFMYAASTGCSTDTIYRLLMESPGII
mmetsp:Transcript_12734/g.23874  ORF Transcript_12734/g.23874 Transcript_12734/m.23874 type:complete len:402 (-) Transcript_12734:68-1273(-)|eukprot:CAMPEP_0176498200 /NCGR_PEP_ID=MMETSP0200_2-20121128/12182_1 /TAXON_ID=947934 /ORGANISM="Chaetoceros sp., Strain GSL56" /LENGTH=401 /DNA_ID=CAMNT_0017896367 /DNA_START=97 /DNA_END=1302 /DNA_ORIENTATION=+